MPILEYIISAIAPHLCLGCRKEGTLLCGVCALNVLQPPPECVFCSRRIQGKLHPYVCRSCRTTLPFDHLIIAASHEGVIKQLIHILKFGRARAAAEPAAQILAPYVSTQERKDAIVTHIPTANRRVRQRGYDQSALIAKRLARSLQLPSAALLRRLGNKRQLGQGRRIRQAQLQDAFRAATELTNRHVILVDDVITTGASVTAAAAVLRSAGAKSITVVVLARASKTS